jgi:MFS family permease
LTVLAADAAFRRLVACRTLIMMMDLATPFYVGHAEDVLHLPASIVGAFVAAQVLGGMTAGALLGLVSERWGPRHVIRIAGVSAFAGPLFALAAHLTGSHWLAIAYPLVYVGVGVVASARLMGFVNYTLEIAPAGMRPTYVGLSNTIIGVTTLVPALGGGLLEATSYTTLFALTTVIGAVGFVLSLALPPAHRGVSLEVGDG